MNSVIKAVVIACCLQMIATLGMSAYIYNLSSHEAKFFSDMAENNAKLAAAELVLVHRNDVQRQFSEEREHMKLYVDQTVDRKVSQAIHIQPTGDK